MKLSKQKQKQLVLVGLVTAAILGALWFGLIGIQQQSLKRIADRKSAGRTEHEAMQKAIASAEKIEKELAVETKALAQHEALMASGDLYSWSINTIRTFKLPYKIEIPQFSQIDGPKPVNLMPDFPYQQASISIGGTGYYHELGRFISDFENAFPHARVCNLNIEPVVDMQSTDREKLLFKMDIVFLVKPNDA